MVWNGELESWPTHWYGKQLRCAWWQADIQRNNNTCKLNKLQSIHQQRPLVCMLRIKNSIVKI